MEKMTDQELLEKAAKAIGLKYHAYVDHPLMGKGINIGDCDSDLWNPLDDDGQALRLAVKLKLRIQYDGREVQVFEENYDSENPICAAEVQHDAQTYEQATRRAIVRVAAQIAAQN